MPEETLVITPEAFGTLMAMKKLEKIRLSDPAIAAELVHFGLAQKDGKALVITKRGKAVRKRAKDAGAAARG